MDNLIYLFAALFSVLNPLGTVPIFVGLTQNYTQQERSKVAFFTALNVLIILLISYFIGQYVLVFFDISIPALRIAGGILIANSGFSLLNGKFSKNKGINKQVEKEVQARENIALTPLAMPMLAGPGSMSLLIAYYEQNHSFSQITWSSIAIVLVAISIFLILRGAHYIAKFLGTSGIVAISRIVGFLTIAIGIQYIINAILSLVKGI